VLFPSMGRGREVEVGVERRGGEGVVGRGKVADFVVGEGEGGLEGEGELMEKEALHLAIPGDVGTIQECGWKRCSPCQCYLSNDHAIHATKMPYACLHLACQCHGVTTM